MHNKLKLIKKKAHLKKVNKKYFNSLKVMFSMSPKTIGMITQNNNF